jgi:anti-sigma regulatory factor (Ser/Thr protein kinase)
VLVPSTRQATAPATPPRWPLQSHFPLPASPLAPAFARGHVRHVVRKYGLGPQLAATGQLIASELVTNALQASAGPADTAIPASIRISIASDGTALLIHVWDASTEIPVPRQITLDQERGWGLLLVASLAENWGVYPEAGGKVVWALIR